MRSLKQVARPPLLLLVILALTAGCEDSGVIAPSDGQMIMTANPSTVTIDDAAGETEGQSTISAQLFDANGFTVEGVSVTFATSSGSLASAPPGESPTPVETDANGVASDVLTLTVLDESTVDVQASSGTLSSSVQVTKVVGSENSRPTAVITATPSDEQQQGYDVSFSGIFSSDPDGIITCYQWTILADRSDDDQSVSKAEMVWQGLGKISVSETYYKEQNVDVTLRVSDDPDAASWCLECINIPGLCGAAATEFNGYADNISYPIVCDMSDPIANAGGDQSGAVGQEITLDGSASEEPDPGVDIVSWRWSCGNGTAIQESETAQCTYDSARTYTATLTVINSCGLTDEDEVLVEISAAR